MRIIFIAAIVPVAFAQSEKAEALMAKAAQAVERNLLQEKHWNWTTTESRVVSAADGRILNRLPSVTVESVIRADGRRCVAVLSWSDGTAPYALEADADTRCGNSEQSRSPLRLEALLRSSRVTVLSRAADGAVLGIQPNKALLHSEDADVRCTASTRATVKLDPATNFPVLVQGDIVETGCEGEVNTELHYGEEPLAKPARRLLLKGTSFRLEYALQPDKFGNSENSFWMCIGQHWTRPMGNRSAKMVFWQRMFELDDARGRKVILDTKSVAQEFGASSQTKFDVGK